MSIDSIMIVKRLLGIPTELTYQSNYPYDHSAKRNELVINLCQCMGAERYLSGNGARKYMQLNAFERVGITVTYQQFSAFLYPQINSQEFHPNLSSLDLLFNCGIQRSRELFWQNVKQGKEVYECNKWSET